MAATKRTSTLRRFLNEMDADALRDELERIVDKFPEVKKFYLADLSGDTNGIVNTARKQVESCFKYSNGNFRRARSSKLNTIQRDFERISVFREDVLALLYFRLEHTAPYLNHFQPTVSPMLDATVRIFERVSEMSKDLQISEKYRPLLEGLILQFDDQQIRQQLETVFAEQFEDDGEAS